MLFTPFFDPEKYLLFPQINVYFLKYHFSNFHFLYAFSLWQPCITRTHTQDW